MALQELVVSLAQQEQPALQELVVFPEQPALQEPAVSPAQPAHLDLVDIPALAEPEVRALADTLGRQAPQDLVDTPALLGLLVLADILALLALQEQAVLQDTVDLMEYLDFQVSLADQDTLAPRALQYTRVRVLHCPQVPHGGHHLITHLTQFQ
jgi:hypothetical protein